MANLLVSNFVYLSIAIFVHVHGTLSPSPIPGGGHFESLALSQGSNRVLVDLVLDLGPDDKWIKCC